MKNVLAFLLVFTVAYFMMCGLVYVYAKPNFVNGAVSVVVATAIGELATSGIAKKFFQYYRLYRAYGGCIKSAWVALLCVCE